MSIKKITKGLIISLLLDSGLAVAADFDKGVEAYQSGDFKTAIAEWTPLAEQGNSDAQFYIAYMYHEGQGVPQNYKTAMKWYTTMAKQGDRWAQSSLAAMYSKGEGVPQNYKTAVKWYTLAAEQGYDQAQNNLGVMYSEGAGVLTDNRLAYMWYNLASYNGNETGGENKDKIAKEMTPADISKAQDMSSRCLERDYKDC